MFCLWSTRLGVWPNQLRRVRGDKRKSGFLSETKSIYLGYMYIYFCKITSVYGAIQNQRNVLGAIGLRSQEVSGHTQLQMHPIPFLLAKKIR